MFSKLREAVAKFTRSVADIVLTREVKEKDIQPFLDELVISLVESDVAYEVAETIVAKIKEKLVGKRIDRKSSLEEVINEALEEALKEIFPASTINLLEAVKKKWSEKREPLKIMFMGVNGVGKTTTIAKVAFMLKNNGITPVIVAADTFRAGAQEQLEVHARRIGVPIIKAKYSSDPAAVAYDAVAFAKKRNYQVVLIDTAGRMHTDRDLMEELRKIVRVVKPDLKILVVDSLTGNDAVEQARVFNKNIGVDGFILTKVDADVKGGTAISIVSSTGRPIIFVGTGQKYEDLEAFNAEWITRKLVSKK